MAKRQRIIIRQAQVKDWEVVKQLAWDTFMKFEAADYGEEGINSFREFLNDASLQRMFFLGEYPVFAAYDEEVCVGMISLRNEKHISLLFVDEKYHRCGIGRELIRCAAEFVRREYGKNNLTVNAAPYALGFYHKIGFEDVAPQMQAEGITYTPMELLLS